MCFVEVVEVDPIVIYRTRIHRTTENHVAPIFISGIGTYWKMNDAVRGQKRCPPSERTWGDDQRPCSHEELKICFLITRTTYCRIEPSSQENCDFVLIDNNGIAHNPNSRIITCIQYTRKINCWRTICACNKLFTIRDSIQKFLLR